MNQKQINSMLAEYLGSVKYLKSIRNKFKHTKDLKECSSIAKEVKAHFKKSKILSQIAPFYGQLRKDYSALTGNESLDSFCADIALRYAHSKNLSGYRKWMHYTYLVATHPRKDLVVNLSGRTIDGLFVALRKPAFYVKWCDKYIHNVLVEFVFRFISKSNNQVCICPNPKCHFICCSALKFCPRCGMLLQERLGYGVKVYKHE